MQLNQPLHSSRRFRASGDERPVDPRQPCGAARPNGSSRNPGLYPQVTPPPAGCIISSKERRTKQGRGNRDPATRSNRSAKPRFPRLTHGIGGHVPEAQPTPSRDSNRHGKPPLSPKTSWWQARHQKVLWCHIAPKTFGWSRGIRGQWQTMTSATRTYGCGVTRPDNRRAHPPAAALIEGGARSIRRRRRRRGRVSKTRGVCSRHDSMTAYFLRAISPTRMHCSKQSCATLTCRGIGGG